MILKAVASKQTIYDAQRKRYIGSVDRERLEMIDALLAQGEVKSLKYALKDIVLDDFQTLLPSVAFLSKKYMIGADTGLGKTLMTALYLKICKSKGVIDKFSKALVCTPNSSIKQMKDTLVNHAELRVLELPGDAKKLEEVMSRVKLEDYDCFLVGVSVFQKSVEFNRILMLFYKLIDVFVLDESMVLANPESTTFKSIKYWFGNVEYKLFLNATVIEKSLDQLYNQFLILDDKLLPTLRTLEQNHVITKKVRIPSGIMRGKYTEKHMGFKDIDKLLGSIPYHYGKVTRVERGLTFNYEDILVPLQVTALQRDIADGTNYVYSYFSPTTQQSTSVIPFTPFDVPALGKVIELTKKEFEEGGGGIVIYAEPVACKAVISKYLREFIPNIRIGIIDGNSSDTKDHYRDAFNRGEVDVLIINIPEALDLYNGRVMIFYTLPSRHYQARARILRGIEKDNRPKKFYYLVYLNSYQTAYIKNTMSKDEKTQDDALNNGITTARNLLNSLIKLNGVGMR